MVLLAIDHERGTPGSERLGEHDRSAAVQHARRLLRARIDRHFGGDVVIAGLDELDAQMRHQGVAAVLLDELERKRIVPDGHARHLNREVGAPVPRCRPRWADVRHSANRKTGSALLSKYGVKIQDWTRETCRAVVRRPIGKDNFHKLSH